MRKITGASRCRYLAAWATLVVLAGGGTAYMTGGYAEPTYAGSGTVTVDNQLLPGLPVGSLSGGPAGGPPDQTTGATGTTVTTSTTISISTTPATGAPSTTGTPGTTGTTGTTDAGASN
jgi:hypothetical protein